MIRDWKQEIAVAWHVQNESAKLDTQKIWQYSLPRVAATEQELVDAEGTLGHTLDPRYRDFLAFANGWAGVMLDIDLFGTAELCGDAMQRARDILESIDEAVIESISVTRAEMLPIGLSAYQHDLFIMPRPNTPIVGTVIWLAGYEVERFATFDDFFLAMVDYNRLRYEELRDGAGD